MLKNFECEYSPVFVGIYTTILYIYNIIILCVSVNKYFVYVSINSFMRYVIGEIKCHSPDGQ